MKNSLFVFALFIGLIFSCAEPESENTVEQQSQKPEVSEVLPNLDSIVEEIESFRNNIEDNLEELDRHEISLGEARSQIKQKWSKMHAYTQGDQLVRVKLYPHEGISTRTEEFYFSNEELQIVFIEDYGKSEGEDNMETPEGKTFWFKDGKLIKSKNKSDDAKVLDEKYYEAVLLNEAEEYKEIVLKKLNEMAE